MSWEHNGQLDVPRSWDHLDRLNAGYHNAGYGGGPSPDLRPREVEYELDFALIFRCLLGFVGVIGVILLIWQPWRSWWQYPPAAQAAPAQQAAASELAPPQAPAAPVAPLAKQQMAQNLTAQSAPPQAPAPVSDNTVGAKDHPDTWWWWPQWARAKNGQPLTFGMGCQPWNFGQTAEECKGRTPHYSNGAEYVPHMRENPRVVEPPPVEPAPEPQADEPQEDPPHYTAVTCRQGLKLDPHSGRCIHLAFCPRTNGYWVDYSEPPVRARQQQTDEYSGYAGPPRHGERPRLYEAVERNYSPAVHGERPECRSCVSPFCRERYGCD